MNTRSLIVPAETEIVLVDGVTKLWHLPVRGDAEVGRRTLCGLAGDLYVYGPIMRDRRCCAVCAERAPRGTFMDAPPKKPAKRRGKPKGKHHKISDVQIRALHVLHWEQRVPMNEIARRYWQRFGYASQSSCATSIHLAFVDRNLPRHDRIEMTRQASTKHGLAPKHGPRPGYGPYKRRVVNGQPDRPQCAAVKVQPPGKGQPCPKRAMHGSDYCFGHDPGRKAQRDAITANMRDRQTPRDLVAWPSVAAALQPILAGEPYPKAALANAAGVPHGTCARLLEGKRATLTADLAARLLKPYGLTISDVTGLRELARDVAEPELAERRAA